MDALERAKALAWAEGVLVSVGAITPESTPAQRRKLATRERAAAGLPMSTTCAYEWDEVDARKGRCSLAQVGQLCGAPCTYITQHGKLRDRCFVHSGALKSSHFDGCACKPCMALRVGPA
jgi:hypothetical protein